MGVGLVEEIEAIIDEPSDIDLKVEEVAVHLMQHIYDDIYEQLGALSEDIVFGRIMFPKVIELTCRLD